MKISYCWTKDEYVKASYLNYRDSVFNKYFQILSLAFLGVFSALLFLGASPSWENTIATLGIIFLVVLITRWPIVYWQLSNSYRKYSEKNCQVEWTITNESLKSKVEGKSEGIIDWSMINKAIVYREGFLLYRYPVFHWFPRAAFAIEADRASFKELLRQKVPIYVEKI